MTISFDHYNDIYKRHIDTFMYQCIIKGMGYEIEHLYIILFS